MLIQLLRSSWFNLNHAQNSIGNEEERIVAELTWIYGYLPLKIFKQYPKIFDSVTHVNKVKKRLLRRVRAWLKEEVADFVSATNDLRIRLVAEFSWLHGLSPEEIYTKFPEHFRDISEVEKIGRRNSRSFRRGLEFLRHNYPEIVENKMEELVAVEVWTEMRSLRNIVKKHSEKFKSVKEVANLRRMLVQKAHTSLTDQDGADRRQYPGE